jgi:hypothetical protein
MRDGEFSLQDLEEGCLQRGENGLRDAVYNKHGNIFCSIAMAFIFGYLDLGDWDACMSG